MGNSTGPGNDKTEPRAGLSYPMHFVATDRMLNAYCPTWLGLSRFKDGPVAMALSGEPSVALSAHMEQGS